MLHRAENEDSGEAKLKALQEDLRVWKAKVSQLAVQLERETKTRSEQEQKITKLQAENKSYHEQIYEAGNSKSHSTITAQEEQRKQAQEKER